MKMYFINFIEVCREGHGKSAQSTDFRPKKSFFFIKLETNLTKITLSDFNSLQVYESMCKVSCVDPVQ